MYMPVKIISILDQVVFKATNFIFIIINVGKCGVIPLKFPFWSKFITFPFFFKIIIYISNIPFLVFSKKMKFVALKTTWSKIEIIFTGIYITNSVFPRKKKKNG